MSKIQEIIDAAEKEWHGGQQDDAFNHLIEAIKLLSKGVAQVMGDFDRAQSSRTDIPIGGGE